MKIGKGTLWRMAHGRPVSRSAMGRFSRLLIRGWFHPFPPVAPLAIDGHAYRRRTRRRKP